MRTIAATRGRVFAALRRHSAHEGGGGVGAGVAGGAVCEEQMAAAVQERFLDALGNEAGPVGPWGWPNMREPPDLSKGSTSMPLSRAK